MSQDRISKVKFDGNKTTVQQIWLDGDNERETRHTKLLPRHPDFDKAMQGLIKPVLTTLGLPEAWEPKMAVSGISLSENESQGMGCVITLIRVYPSINAPLVINTPHLHQDLSDTGKSAMPAEIEQQLEIITDEAFAWLGGKSSQLDLLNNESAA